MNLVLPSGNTMVIYVNSPDSITINDIGLTVAFTVFTSQAMYYKETNVKASPSAHKTKYKTNNQNPLSLSLLS